MAVPAVPCVQQHSSAGVWAARGAAPAGVVRAGQGIAFLHLDFCVPCPRMLVSARTEQGLVAFPGQSAGGKVFWAETLPRDCPEAASVSVPLGCFRSGWFWRSGVPGAQREVVVPGSKGQVRPAGHGAGLALWVVGSFGGS